MYFCLSCTTGSENKTRLLVEKELKRLAPCNFKVYFPTKEQTHRIKGKPVNVNLPLFPGYLFIYWEDEDEKTFPFYMIKRIPEARRFLCYDDRTCALKGRDHLFATWIDDNNGTISQSKVLYTPGQKLHIVQGPLTGFDGQVVSVDRHHRQISVLFDIGGISNIVKFSVEFLQSNTLQTKLTDTLAN